MSAKICATKEDHQRVNERIEATLELRGKELAQALAKLSNEAADLDFVLEALTTKIRERGRDEEFAAECFRLAEEGAAEVLKALSA